MIIWNRKGMDEVNKRLVFALNKTGIDTLTNITNSNVVPFDKSTLEKSGDIEKAKTLNDAIYISWDGPYAKKLYFHPEYNFRNGRIGRWADAWIRGSKTRWVLNTFQSNASKELR